MDKGMNCFSLQLFDVDDFFSRLLYMTICSCARLYGRFSTPMDALTTTSFSRIQWDFNEISLSFTVCELDPWPILLPSGND